MNRREFLQFSRQALVSGAAATAGLSLLGISLRQPPVPKSRQLEPPVLRPPGALAEDQFLAQCIRCQRCRDACPRGAIRLAGPGDPAPAGTPFISATDTACNLCLACTQTCPTEALTPLARKEDVRMGVAVIDPRTCVSINRSGVCGACHTACPLKNQAITLGLHNAPKVHPEACVGCGLCEEACIVKGTKAIRVFSHRSPQSNVAASNRPRPSSSSSSSTPTDEARLRADATNRARGRGTRTRTIGGADTNEIQDGTMAPVPAGRTVA